MRRTSLTPEQAHRLGELVRDYRLAAGLSMRQLAIQTAMNVSLISKLEAGRIVGPLPETLKDLARALHIPMSDLLVIADWLPVGELPTLKPYLRAKYHDLDEQAITELERYADQLAQRHGGLGPTDHEDEQP